MAVGQTNLHGDVIRDFLELLAGHRSVATTVAEANTALTILAAVSTACASGGTVRFVGFGNSGPQNANSLASQKARIGRMPIG